jgi:YHS domain-containing protein
MTRDPVCGRQVDEKTATARINYKGREYQFCSQDCKRQFDQRPESYAQQQTRSAAPQQTEGGAA